MNHGDYPRVIYDAANNPSAYTCYTGANAGDPFAKNSTVQPNDVTASLWVLVRQRLAVPANFICPSTSDETDFIDTTSSELAQRGNFRSPETLSYSYASPFSSAPGYKLNDTRRAGFALMADKNPGVQGTQSNAASPSVNAPPLQMEIANSNNHRKAGQNVLYTDSHVEFKPTPYCGIGDEIQPDLHDNIYTALAPRPLEYAHYVPRYSNGVLGRDVAPAWDFDSYLVPTSTDQLELPAIVIATQPPALPVTLPATHPAASEPTTTPATSQARVLSSTTQTTRATTTNSSASRPTTTP